MPACFKGTGRTPLFTLVLLLTATAFGSLWVSNQPGISSMGKLLALSLVCTLTSAALFQPALMGDPRHYGGGTPSPTPGDRPNS